MYDKMATRTAVAQRERLVVVPVLFTKERYRQDEMDRVVLPEGTIRATLRQSTLYYQHNEEFRNDLWNNACAWTSDKGLDTSGFKEILPNGDFKAISEGAFDKLSPENRSYHWEGSDFVAVDGYFCGDKSLLVVARVGAVDAARIAYVRVEDVERAAKAARRQKP